MRRRRIGGKSRFGRESGARNILVLNEGDVLVLIGREEVQNASLTQKMEETWLTLINRGRSIGVRLCRELVLK